MRGYLAILLASCSASVGLAQWQQAQVAAQSTAAIGDGLNQWQMLRQGSGYPFATYAAFLNRFPGWPGESDLRRAAERVIGPADSPGQVVGFFARNEPVTPQGWLRYAEALDASGRRGEAVVAARKAWAGGALSDADRLQLTIRFAGDLDAASHDARMDRLLWLRSTAPATTQLSLTSGTRRSLFAARLAMQTRAPDVDFHVANTQGTGPADAGWLLDRANLYRANGQEDAARALMARPRTLAAPPLDPVRWLDALWFYAQGAAAAGSSQTAYDIARQLSDAYPAGTVVRDRPLAERDDYTNLAFMAGSLAYHQLGRPADAIAHYERYAAAARTAQTQSKGLYWAGRAALRAGRTQDANRFFERAAAYVDQFYGQLANERLGRVPAFPLASGQGASAQERAAFLAKPLVQAARVLGERGDWSNQSLFLRAIAADLKSDGDAWAAAEFADRIGRPDLRVMVGRNVDIGIRRSFVPAGFPTSPLNPQAQPAFTIAHAIARQESQFDRRIVSRAGARGLMQLMPGTAAETAGKMGLDYVPSMLDDPRYNADLGSYYISRLLDRYNGNFVLAVAAYNAGAGNVNKWLATNGDPRAPGRDVIEWIEDIPFKETRDYVQRVLENAVIYDQINPGGRRRGLSEFLGKSTPG